MNHRSIALTIIAAHLLAACGPAAEPIHEEVRPVRTVVAGRTAGTVGATYSGEIRARYESQLGFRTSGKIVARLVEVGSHVKRGQPLLQLDPATDLTTGAPFEFTAEQFALLCSDLNSVPLSFAVAASSSVPILLSPVTLKNYAGACPQSRQMADFARSNRILRTRLVNESVQSYLDVENRPFLHLVDGGLVDNLGVRGLLDRTAAGGSLDASFHNLPASSVHKIVLISVNSERDTAERIDRSDRIPTTGQVLDALTFGAGSRATSETIASMNDNVRQWTQELTALRGKHGSPFAADAEIHVISVSLRDVKDAKTRDAILHVPTAFTILPIQVRQLEKAGRVALRESPEFQRLRDSLDAEPGRPKPLMANSSE